MNPDADKRQDGVFLPLFCRSKHVDIVLTKLCYYTLPGLCTTLIPVSSALKTCMGLAIKLSLP